MLRSDCSGNRLGHAVAEDLFLEAAARAPLSAAAGTAVAKAALKKLLHILLRERRLLVVAIIRMLLHSPCWMLLHELLL